MKKSLLKILGLICIVMGAALIVRGISNLFLGLTYSSVQGCQGANPYVDALVGLVFWGGIICVGSVWIKGKTLGEHFDEWNIIDGQEVEYDESGVEYEEPEDPDKIVGKKILIKSVECAPNGLNEMPFPFATVLGFENEKYTIVFDQPFELNNKVVKQATISARHVGHPISNSKRSGLLAVAGDFDSGDDFIACIVRLD